MKAVIQRVAFANVKVEGKTVGEIKNGFLVLLGVEDSDSREDADVLAKKIVGLRIFEDSNGKMNLALADVGGSVLAVSQFTLLADCKKGKRPSFVKAAKSDFANEMYEYFCAKIIENGIENVQKGVFGADMKVELINDGPVTIIMDTNEWK